MPEENYISDPEQIRIRERRELQALLGKPPGWLLHYGITVVALGVIIVFVVGWLVRYPDIVKAPVQLITQVPPIEVVAEAAGQLSEFRVQDNDQVEEGEVIAVLDDPAQWQDIEAVDQFLEQLQDNLYSRTKLKALVVPRDLELGDLQTTYAAFLKRFDEHLFFLKNNNTPKRIKNLERQISKLTDLERSLQVQETTLEEVVEISERNFRRTQELRSTGDASEKELSEDQARYLRAKQNLETLNEEQLNNRLLIEQIRMQILQINQSYTDGRSDGMLSIQEEVQRMQSAINRWQKEFMIKAPVAGQVSLHRFRTSRQFIDAGELLLTIIPGTASQVIGEGFLPARGSGKVKAGMRANVRLDAYPYQEFGSIPGKVEQISLVPQQEGFQVKLSVPDPLVTSFGDTIPFQQQMRASANIVTEERRLLLRIFDRLYSLIASE